MDFSDDFEKSVSCPQNLFVLQTLRICFKEFADAFKETGLYP